MNNLEKSLEKLEKEKKKKEQALHNMKRIQKQIKQEQRRYETKRKIEKGGVFESFERSITES